MPPYNLRDQRATLRMTEGVGQITGHTDGRLNLLFHRETLELLWGVHIFGEDAAELLHMGQARGSAKR